MEPVTSENAQEGPGLFGPGGVLAQLAAGLSDGVWLIDSSGHTAFANPAMAELLHCPLAKLDHRPASDFVDEAEMARIRQELVEHSGKGAAIADLAVTCADGERIWTRFNVLPWKDDTETGLVAVVQNITERRAAEEAQAVLAAIVHSSDDAIISKTLEGVITSWNTGATRIFGYAAKEVIGKSITMLIPPDRQDEEAEILARLRRGEQIRHYESVRLRKDGTPIDISVTISPIRDADGVIVGASKVARDISNRKHSEEAQGHLAAIVESSDDAIVSKRLDSTVQTWNRGAERLFGYTAEEMIGKPITLLLPEDRLQEEDHILARIRKGLRVEPFETVRRTKDGRLIDVSITISPIRNSRGEVIGASKIARDISDQKRVERTLRENEEALRKWAETLEQRVQERTSELQASLQEMEGFTYTISHDLRAPLRAIIASCRVLEEDFKPNLPPEANRILQRQVEAANKMAVLIDDLLRLSRLGRKELNVVPIDLSRLASEVSADISADVTAEEAAMPPEIKIQAGLTAVADETLVRLALQNLLENSVKFAKPGEPARIEIGREEDAFFVRDHGIGFDPQYADRIFAPFERLHRDTEYPGTGIGLANVRRIVERHHGRVWADGRPGEGATFFFTLPARSDAEK
jgi:PAS domain S-box-containing protein